MPKFSSWSKTELWQVVDVEPLPVFGKFYNGLTHLVRRFR